MRVNAGLVQMQLPMLQALHWPCGTAERRSACIATRYEPVHINHENAQCQWCLVWQDGQRQRICWRSSSSDTIGTYTIMHDVHEVMLQLDCAGKPLLSGSAGRSSSANCPCRFRRGLVALPLYMTGMSRLKHGVSNQSCAELSTFDERWLIRA